MPGIFLSGKDPGTDGRQFWVQILKLSLCVPKQTSHPPEAGWTGGKERRADGMRGSQLLGCAFISDVKCGVTCPHISIRQRRVGVAGGGGLAGSGVDLPAGVVHKELPLSLPTCTGPATGETRLIVSAFASPFKYVFEAALPGLFGGVSCEWIITSLPRADRHYPSSRFAASANLAEWPP